MAQNFGRVPENVGDVINISIHLPFPIYNNEILHFSVKKNDEYFYVYEEISTNDSVVLTCMYIMSYQNKCSCQEE